MKFIVSNKDKVAKFLTIMKNMKSLLLDVIFGLCEQGLYIQGMDSAHVGLFELKLETGWFDEWKGLKKFHYNLGVNCDALSTIMNCYSAGQYIEFSYMENSSETLIIKLEGNGHDKMFELKLIDIDVDLMEIPDIEYDADITMNSSEFNNLMAESSLFGDTINVSLGIDDFIYMTTTGDRGNMKVRIKEEDIVEYALSEDTTLDHNYALKYCLMYSKFTKINKNVMLHLKDDTPLKIVYNMGHWIDEKGDLQEDDDLLNYLGFYLAPKIDEDE